jgi:hypothetical protein
MTVYLVIQNGVYRHDVRGVYTTKENAENAARRSAAEDRDAYHSYAVFEAELDAYVEDVKAADDLPGFRQRTHRVGYLGGLPEGRIVDFVLSAQEHAMLELARSEAAVDYEAIVSSLVSKGLITWQRADAGHPSQGLIALTTAGYAALGRDEEKQA